MLFLMYSSSSMPEPPTYLSRTGHFSSCVYFSSACNSSTSQCFYSQYSMISCRAFNIVIVDLCCTLAHQHHQEQTNFDATTIVTIGQAADMLPITCLPQYRSHYSSAQIRVLVCPRLLQVLVHNIIQHRLTPYLRIHPRNFQLPRVSLRSPSEIPRK